MEDTNTANIVSTQHLINVTDFTDPHMLTHTTLDPVSNNDGLQNYSSISKKVKEARKEKKSKQELKVDMMHMKRRLPQLYLTNEERQGKTGSINAFNAVLKK